MDADDRRALRQAMRTRRRGLSRAAVEAATARALRNLKSLGLPRHGSRIGLFLPFDGEPGTASLIAYAVHRRCRIYLPVITDLRRRRMIFVEWRTGMSLVRSPAGIHEPRDRRRRLSPRLLDLVIVPLVAFDARCNRIGSGGGFYDRHFGFRLRRSTWHRPVLVGWAHDFQHVDPIATAGWDVPLDFVVTDHGIYRR
jgi:5-formyltetrahydrofolate cyclo-ligase